MSRIGADTLASVSAVLGHRGGYVSRRRAAISSSTRNCNSGGSTVSDRSNPKFGDCDRDPLADAVLSEYARFWTRSAVAGLSRGISRSRANIRRQRR